MLALVGRFRETPRPEEIGSEEDDGRPRAAAAARLGAARSDPRLRPGNLSEPIEAVYFFPWNYGGEICNGSCGF